MPLSTLSDEGNAFTAENLADMDVVVCASSNYKGQELQQAERAALEAFVRAGGGWMGWHYAVKEERGWPFIRSRSALEQP